MVPAPAINSGRGWCRRGALSDGPGSPLYTAANGAGVVASRRAGNEPQRRAPWLPQIRALASAPASRPVVAAGRRTNRSTCSTLAARPSSSGSRRWRSDSSSCSSSGASSTAANPPAAPPEMLTDLPGISQNPANAFRSSFGRACSVARLRANDLACGGTSGQGRGMRLLIIGGTSFLGRAAAVQALRRGDTVTTFNRGKSAPDVEGVEALRGDRDDESALDQLNGREFDGVVDTCGFVPRVVAEATALCPTRSATPPLSRASPPAVNGPARSLTTVTPDRPAPVTPGRTAATTACSRPAASVPCVRSSATGRRSRRPGLILGPPRGVGQLTWWLSRMARRRRSARARRSRPSHQLIDARDLATYLLNSIDAGTRALTTCRHRPTTRRWAAGSATPCTPSVLTRNSAGSRTTSCSPTTSSPGPSCRCGCLLGRTPIASRTPSRAAPRGPGSTCRPVSETVPDTWAWMRADDVQPGNVVGRFGGQSGQRDGRRQGAAHPGGLARPAAVRAARSGDQQRRSRHRRVRARHEVPALLVGWRLADRSNPANGAAQAGPVVRRRQPDQPQGASGQSCGHGSGSTKKSWPARTRRAHQARPVGRRRAPVQPGRRRSRSGRHRPPRAAPRVRWRSRCPPSASVPTGWRPERAGPPRRGKRNRPHPAAPPVAGADLCGRR